MTYGLTMAFPPRFPKLHGVVGGPVSFECGAETSDEDVRIATDVLSHLEARFPDPKTVHERDVWDSIDAVVADDRASDTMTWMKEILAARGCYPSLDSGFASYEEMRRWLELAASELGVSATEIDGPPRRGGKTFKHFKIDVPGLGEVELYDVSFSFRDARSRANPTFELETSTLVNHSQSTGPGTAASLARIVRGVMKRALELKAASNQ